MFTAIILCCLFIAAILSIPLGLNTAYIPGPLDDATRLETAQTKTATFAGTSFDMGAGYTPGGPGQRFGAVVKVAAIDRADGNETYLFKVQESADGATWTDASPSVSTAAVGAFSIPFFLSQRFVRVSPALGGTTPSVTYDAWLVPLQ